MILLIGGTGYIGLKFQEILAKRNLEYLNLSRQNIDYYNYRTLADVIQSSKPEFVINAAGFTGKPNVDQCEVQKADTINGNVVLPLTIAQACDINNVPLVHVSSGCIYSGDKGIDSEDNKIGFTELDEPNFTYNTPRRRIRLHKEYGAEVDRDFECSFYSGSKALGEAVLSQFDKVYTCRLRIPFDEVASPRNYISKLMQYDILYNAENSISHRTEFVDACIDLAIESLPTGIYNITNSDYITTEQVADMINDMLNLDREFKYWLSDSHFYGQAATTLRSSCVMDNTKLLSTGIHMRTGVEALEASLTNWIK